jgi:hypothetical protein
VITHINIIDVVGIRARSVLAIDSNGDLFTYSPDHSIGTDSDKCLAIRRAVIDHETINWKRAQFELSMDELDEIRFEARSILIRTRPARENQD